MLLTNVVKDTQLLLKMDGGNTGIHACLVYLCSDAIASNNNFNMILLHDEKEGR